MILVKHLESAPGSPALRSKEKKVYNSRERTSGDLSPQLPESAKKIKSLHSSQQRSKEPTDLRRSSHGKTIAEIQNLELDTKTHTKEGSSSSAFRRL